MLYFTQIVQTIKTSSDLMKKQFVRIALCLLFLAACSTPAPQPSPSLAPEPTVPPAPTPTPFPHVQLSQPADIFTGPGNADFLALEHREAGDFLEARARYGDFIQVITMADGHEAVGYVWERAVLNLPAGLPQLSAAEVPPRAIFSSSCSPRDNSPVNSAVSSYNPGSTTMVTESEVVTLTSPLQIRIESLAVQEADYGAVRLTGISLGQSNGRQDPARMDLFYDRGRVGIQVRSSSADGAVFSPLDESGLDAAQAIQVIFDQPEGKSFSVLNGQGGLIRHVDLAGVPGLNLSTGLFPEGEAYIGMVVLPGSSLIPGGFFMGAVPDGVWQEEEPADSLAGLAAPHNLTIGTEFSLDATVDQAYCRAMWKHFNLVALSGFSLPGYWLAPGQYDFSELDRQVDFAVRAGWRVRGMHLVWGATENSVLPGWLVNGTYSREELLKILEQHVKTVAGYFRGRVQEWSIANEVATRSLNPGSDFWLDRIGPEYVELAFGWAREADPQAVLILNDNNNEAPRDEQTRQVFDRLYEGVKDLKERGIPVDGVGMQMHLLFRGSSPDLPSRSEVATTMRKFGALGLKVFITEMDVDLHNIPGTIEERLKFQAGAYRDMLAACIASGVCVSFTTWGIGDANSWLTCSDSWCMNEPDAAPLLFDEDYRPKPAFIAVRDLLKNTLPEAP